MKVVRARDSKRGDVWVAQGRKAQAKAALERVQRMQMKKSKRVACRPPGDLRGPSSF